MDNTAREGEAMARQVVAHSTNGAKARNGRRPTVQSVGTLAAQVDHLAELRALIRKAQREERRLTGEVLQALQTASLSALAGHQAVAILETRMTLRPDPQLFVRAVGSEAWPALTVSITAARKLMGERELERISELVTAPVLRVEPLNVAAEA